MVDRLIGHGDTPRAAGISRDRDWTSAPTVGPGDKIGPNAGSGHHHQRQGSYENCRSSHVRGSFPIRSTVHENQNRLHHPPKRYSERKGA